MTNLTPEQQAERDRLQAILDDLNRQIEQVITKMSQDLAAIYARKVQVQNGRSR